jgi:hypothetical protein
VKGGGKFVVIRHSIANGIAVLSRFRQDEQEGITQREKRQGNKLQHSLNIFAALHFP